VENQGGNWRINYNGSSEEMERSGSGLPRLDFRDGILIDLRIQTLKCSINLHPKTVKVQVTVLTATVLS